VGTISDGTFVATRVGTTANNDRNATVMIQNGKSYEGFQDTGIDTISGGHFSGAYFAIVSVADYSNSYINYITGGTFLGTIALQNDNGGMIKEISGGKITGSGHGILNVNKIGTIGGNANISGNGYYGIYNYPKNGTIDEIRDSTAITGGEFGILNSGTIKLISGGTIIGGKSAINCDGSNKGTLEKITNGVFWGKTNVSIQLSSKLLLEPELSATIGFGRYWGNEGVIFNDDNLVDFPGAYIMSIQTLPVTGIQEVEFKYLMLPAVVRGTVFPFTHYGEKELDELFPVTARLYDISLIPQGTAAILAATPLYTDTAVYYDGTEFIPNTPKYPGYLGCLTNPGFPINKAAFGFTGSVHPIVPLLEGEKPQTALGLYKFSGVVQGEYILVLSRGGFVTRFAKINVNTENKIIEHRELIPGDVNGNFTVEESDILIMLSKISEYGSALYEPFFDLNGDLKIDMTDISIMKVYMQFRAKYYEDSELFFAD
jgi:hypothetical protein